MIRRNSKLGQAYQTVIYKSLQNCTKACLTPCNDARKPPDRPQMRAPPVLGFTLDEKTRKSDLPGRCGQGHPQDQPLTMAAELTVAPTASETTETLLAAGRHRQQHLIHAPNEARRVFELPAFGQKRLVEQQVRPVVEARFLELEPGHQRMLRVDLENGL